MRPRLIHRIDIEQPVVAQDPMTGEMTTGWDPYKTQVAAKVTALSARELVSAQAEQSEIVGRIQINYDDGILPTMRAIHRGQIYVFHGAVPDHVTGLKWLTIPVSAGVTDE